MVRLYTEKLHISYGERLIVKNLSVNIPDKRLLQLLVQTDAANQRF